MIRFLRILIMVAAALLLQVTILPRLLTDPFQPDFLILIVVHAGLHWPFPLGAPLAFVLGLLQDCFSGTSFGLNGFSYLLVFFILNRVADRLYTDNLALNVLAVFVASIVQGMAHLFLLLLFPAAPTAYISLVPLLIPHAAVNAGVAFIIHRIARRLNRPREAS